MNYTASVSDHFKSPKWMMNTLLAGVCVFIPLIGQIVIKGWLITGFWGRDDQRAESFGGAFRLRTAQRTVPASAAKS